MKYRHHLRSTFSLLVFGFASVSLAGAATGRRHAEA